MCVVPGESHYHCYGCGVHGDAIDFVRRLNPGMTFRDAVRAIEGDLPRSPDLPSPPPARTVTRSKPDRPEGWQNFARDVVDRAEAFLWSVRGAEARSYLRWRGLREETIRTARLGYWPDDEHVEDIFPDKKVWVPRGIVIPGFDGPDVEFINVRRPEGDPKYFAILGSRRDGLYPGRTGIVVGKPVSIVEGEFETLLLRQEIGDLIPVVTLGSAGNKPSARVKNTLLGASPWIVAGDADAAGEKSADDSMAQSDRYVRVAPPKGFGKGWTEAQEKGLDLRTWWQLVLDRLANRERPGEDGAHPTVPPHFIAGPVPIEGPSEPMLSAPSAREAVAACLDNWRLRWGGLANACSAQGMPAREAEEKAAVEVKAGLNAAGYGPPPAMDPDPYIALWLYELNDLIASGEAARHLPPGEFRRVQALPAGEPLDCEAMRSVVHAVRAQMWTERCRALGVPESPFDVDRWRCLSTTCLHKG